MEIELTSPTTIDAEIGNIGSGTTYTAGNGIEISASNVISIDEDITATKDYVDDGDETVMDKVETEQAAREAAISGLESSKLDATKCTFQTTAPSAAISDGGVHIVYLSSAPATKYDGYIYMIAEA